MSRSCAEESFEVHAGHEQRSKHRHAAQALAVYLVVDPEPAIALAVAERLIERVAKQADATLRWERAAGTRAILIFPL